MIRIKNYNLDEKEIVGFSDIEAIYPTVIPYKTSKVKDKVVGYCFEIYLKSGGVINIEDENLDKIKQYYAKLKSALKS